MADAVAGSPPLPSEPTRGKRHMIAAAHPLAARAGREILRAGGSAVDAAIGGLTQEPHLLILGAILLAALPLCPWAAAAALRLNLE